MGTMADLTIGTAASSSDATSPRTYTKASKSTNLVSWEQRTSGIFDQYLKLSLGRREATQSVPIRKVTLKLSIPVVHSIASVDTVVGYYAADLSVRVPAIATTAEINAATIQMQNIILDTVLEDAIKGDFAL